MTKIQFDTQLLKTINHFKKYGGEVYVSLNKETVFSCKHGKCSISVCDETDVHIVYGYALDMVIPLKQIAGFGVNKDKSLFMYVGKDVDNQTMINIC